MDAEEYMAVRAGGGWETMHAWRRRRRRARWWNGESRKTMAGARRGREPRKQQRSVDWGRALRSPTHAGAVCWRPSRPQNASWEVGGRRSAPQTGSENRGTSARSASLIDTHAPGGTDGVGTTRGPGVASGGGWGSLGRARASAARVTPASDDRGSPTRVWRLGWGRVSKSGVAWSPTHLHAVSNLRDACCGDDKRRRDPSQHPHWWCVPAVTVAPRRHGQPLSQRTAGSG